MAAFGARAFQDTFGPDNTPDDMAAYLAATYSERRQSAELTDPTIVTIVVEQHAAVIAFAQVRQGVAPECVTGAQPVELWRFYVGREWHGRGVAQALMDAVWAAARQLGGHTMWLSVWEHNPRAIAFYGKCGFTDVGSKLFIVGSDAQTDRVMARELASTSSV